MTIHSERGGTGYHPRDDRLAEATQVKILVPGDQNMVALLGQRDELLKLVEAAFDSHIVVRGNEITISGPPRETDRVALLFEELIELLDRGHELTASSVGRSIELIKGDEARPTQVLGDVLLTGRGKGVAPKTLGQKQYVDAIRNATVTFAVGPAGTGKTYLAVATAVRALQEKEVTRLILSRPAVEAGERLGFLPGTLYEKIDPYMKPLYDALFEMMGADALPRLMERPEHDARADEDVPHASGVRLQGGRERRRYADRPPRGADVWPGRRAGHPHRYRRDRDRAPRGTRRRPSQDRAGHRGGVPCVRGAARACRWLTPAIPLTATALH
jgi:hypothetical protein